MPARGHPFLPIAHRRVGVWRPLDDSVRTGVRPDSVQVLDGMLSSRLPTSVICVALYRFAFPSGTVPARG